MARVIVKTRLPNMMDSGVTEIEMVSEYTSVAAALSKYYDPFWPNNRPIRWSTKDARDAYWWPDARE